LEKGGKGWQHSLRMKAMQNGARYGTEGISASLAFVGKIEKLKLVNFSGRRKKNSGG